MSETASDTGPADAVRPEAGARVVAVDPRTGIEVFGVSGGVNDGHVTIDPMGPGYPPGGFSVPMENAEVVAAPDDDMDAYEQRKRTEWDVVCMVLSGALENLSDGTVEFVSNFINEGHL